MKRGFGFFVLVGVLLLAGVASAATPCALSVSLLNQDPYPAVPGEYVKVVFQITGSVNPDCGKITFTPTEEFPFTLDPGEQKTKSIFGGTYVRNYESSVLVPYEFRVDKDALDGDTPLEAILSFEREGFETTTQIETVNINVQSVDVDFEISVKDFDSTTNTLTFEILNTGENDVKAVTLEIPQQEDIEVKGSNRNIVGDLDSNEDTTAKFEASPKDGEIEVKILYTDEVNVRRELTKTVLYDSSYFTGRKADEAKKQSAYFYLFWLLIIVWIGLWIRKKWKKRKMREHEKHHLRK